MISTQYPNGLHSPPLGIVVHRNYNGERGIFRAAKELCRFVMTTIVVANATKCTASAASIITNYHKTAASRNGRRSVDSINLPVKTQGKADNLNLWHFRTFSTCSASPFDSDPVMIRRGGDAYPTRRSKDLAVAASSRQVRRKYIDENEDNLVDDPFEDGEYQPTLEEMRAQLGPVGLMVANAVEVGVTTAGSFMSGGIFGYLIGGVTGVPGLFRNPNAGTSVPPPDGISRNGIKDVQRRIGSWNSQALAQGKSWGQLSASFSGFHALTRVARGGVEDRWNGILGSALTGAYLSRKGGPQAMIQGAYTYAGFTYVLDFVFASGSRGGKGDGEFDFTDTPLPLAEERGY